VPTQSRAIGPVPAAIIPTADSEETNQSTEDGGGGSAVGAAIGGVVAGVVVLAAIAFFVRRQYHHGTATLPKFSGLASTSDPMPHTDSNTSGADENPSDVTTPIAPNPLDYVATPVTDPADLTFKHQCLSVDGPISGLGQEEGVSVPLAHAVYVSDPSTIVAFPSTGATDASGFPFDS
jgi:hypothetical protein